jgi:hypothetical protein
MAGETVDMINSRSRLGTIMRRLLPARDTIRNYRPCCLFNLRIVAKLCEDNWASST